MKINVNKEKMTRNYLRDESRGRLKRGLSKKKKKKEEALKACWRHLISTWLDDWWALFAVLKNHKVALLRNVSAAAAISVCFPSVVSCFLFLFSFAFHGLSCANTHDSVSLCQVIRCCVFCLFCSQRPLTTRICAPLKWNFDCCCVLLHLTRLYSLDPLINHLGKWKPYRSTNRDSSFISKRTSQGLCFF